MATEYTLHSVWMDSIAVGSNDDIFPLFRIEWQTRESFIFTIVALIWLIKVHKLVQAYFPYTLLDNLYIHNICSHMVTTLKLYVYIEYIVVSILVHNRHKYIHMLITLQNGAVEIYKA